MFLQVCLRGLNVFSGYFKNDKETQVCFFLTQGYYKNDKETQVLFSLSLPPSLPPLSLSLLARARALSLSLPRAPLLSLSLLPSLPLLSLFLSLARLHIYADARTRAQILTHSDSLILIHLITP